MKRFRKCVFDIILPDYGDSVLGRAFDTAIMVLILVSVIIAFAVTFDLSPAVSGVLAFIEPDVFRNAFSGTAFLSISTGIVTVGLTERAHWKIRGEGRRKARAEAHGRRA